jgi:hypothetical protein
MVCNPGGIPAGIFLKINAHDSRLLDMMVHDTPKKHVPRNAYCFFVFIVIG